MLHLCWFTPICVVLWLPPSWDTVNIVTFIDDFSKYTIVYFLAQKSAVLSHFKTYKALVENQLGLKIKALCSDNRGKYISKDFLPFVKSMALLGNTPFHIHQNKTTWLSVKTRLFSMLRIAWCLPLAFHIPIGQILLVQPATSKILVTLPHFPTFTLPLNSGLAISHICLIESFGLSYLCSCSHQKVGQARR